MNVLILEDESRAANRLTSLLHQYEPAIQVVGQLPSVHKAVAWFSTNPDPDLLFVDVHLEDTSAFELFDQVTIQLPVIFTTAYEKYVLPAFRVSSIDYLLKPIHYEQLASALDKYKTFQRYFNPTAPELPQKSEAQSVPGVYKDRFMTTVGNRIRSLSTSEVGYFFAEEKMTFLSSLDGQHLPIDYSLDKLTPLLDPRLFFRISRQYLVSLAAIRSIHITVGGRIRLELKPSPRHEVWVSGDRASAFKTWLGK